MTRKNRGALEFFGPPALGAMLLAGSMAAVSLWDWLTTGRAQQWSWEAPGVFGMMLAFAYLFAGLPSLLYAVIMEWRFARGLNPASRRAVAWSSALGLASGLVIGGVLSGGRLLFGAYAMFGGLGVAVGFLLGWFIKWRSDRTG